MADTLAIRRRIKSVASTRQITKAMQLVSAAKLRAASVAATNAEIYRERLDTLLTQVAHTPDWKTHPLLRPVDSDVTHIVLIGSDRSLAGSYHSRLEAVLGRLTAEEVAVGHSVEVTTIGKIPATIAARLATVEVVDRYAGLNVLPSIWEVYPMVRRLLQRHEAGEIGRLKVIATRFESALRQHPEVRTLIPLTDARGEMVTPEEQKSSQTARLPQTAILPPTLEPDPATAITIAVHNWLQAAFLDAATTAVASEHSMRMLAMQNATNNASDLIDDLTLEYNTARQAAITQELAEISGGVAALT